MSNSNDKDKATSLRRQGKTFREIEEILGIPKSTLNYWLKDIELTEKQEKNLEHNIQQNKRKGGEKGRAKAALVHKQEKRRRVNKIEKKAKDFVSNIEINREIDEIIFSIFYLAEGTKNYSKGTVEFSNADPKVMTFFLKLFRRLYSPEESKLRSYLHLRKDQSEEELKNYWSKLLDIPKSQFIKTHFDERATEPTFESYKGVCVVYYCDTDLHRRIMTVGEEILAQK